MTKKHLLLINPKTVNKYYHLNLGGVDRLFAWFFRGFNDRNFQRTHARLALPHPAGGR